MKGIASVRGLPVLFLGMLMSAFATPAATPCSPTDTACFTALYAELPVLGSNAGHDDFFEEKLAAFAKTVGEASMKSDSAKAPEQQAGLQAFAHFRDQFARQIEQKGQTLLSPYGMASLSLQIDMQGNFSGSRGQLLTPWYDDPHLLTFSQVGVSQTDIGTLGSAGLGQRWTTGDWLIGYNTFFEQLVDRTLRRISVGAEAWRDFLRFSARYMKPVSRWRDESCDRQWRFAEGYRLTTQGYFPFYRQLGMSLSYEQFRGEQVSTLDRDVTYLNPGGVKLGVNYTPVPLLTFTAIRNVSEGGHAHNQLGMRVNYRPGVALQKQLSADQVAVAHSLRGSTHDWIEPGKAALEYRKRDTFSVFLATPPWALSARETVPLRLQLQSPNPVTHINWQGDTALLSLTPPADNTSLKGWTIIMPVWDDSPAATNKYRLSVTLTDSHQKQVTSNWITLQAQPPGSIKN